MKKTICLIICVTIAFAFASCKNGANKTTQDNSSTEYSTLESTEATTESTEVSDTTAKNGEAKSDTTDKNSKEKTSKKKKKATTEEENEEDYEGSIPISREEALEVLSQFYGDAYNVEQKKQKGDIQYYEVRDNKGNLYAKVEVNLKNSDAKEIVEHSGEEYKFNLLV